MKKQEIKNIMKAYLKKLFPKYNYESGDIIYIASSAIHSDNDKFKATVLLKVEVLQRKLSGYVVQDADRIKYLIKYKYVVTKE